MSNFHVTTTITKVPFRCVVCGYVDEVLTVRHETTDPWAVMFTVDTVHQLIGAGHGTLTNSQPAVPPMPTK
jgi:hypothetical protein